MGGGIITCTTRVTFSPISWIFFAYWRSLGGSLL